MIGVAGRLTIRQGLVRATGFAGLFLAYLALVRLGLFWAVLNPVREGADWLPPQGILRTP